MSLRIIGGGVAAATCAHLSDAAGLSVSWDAQLRPRVPTILLSDAALGLMRDVYGRPELFADKPRVTRRIVKWGPRDPVSLPHGGVLVSEDDLESALAPAWRQGGCNAASASPRASKTPDFSIFTANPLPQDQALTFGHRQAVAVPVALHGEASLEECRIESLPSGWLFLVPETAGRGWLLGFGAPLDELLDDSTLIAPHMTVEGDAKRPFDTAPRLTMPLAGDDWLACGTTAVRFDPICGDGTAQAVREALLASAMINAIADGGDKQALLLHYRSMLVAAMRRHLKMCAEFYAGAASTPWWHAQCAELVKGYHHVTQILGEMPEPRFVLRGSTLVPRELAQ